MTERKVSVSVMCMDYTAMGKQFELLNDFTDAYHWMLWMETMCPM
jgi:hypothetical protein